MTQKNIILWSIGLLGISVIAGALLTRQCYLWLCKLAGVEPTGPQNFKYILTEKGVLTGIFERVFFTVAVAADLSGTAVAMVAWIGIKNQVLWQSFTKNGGDPKGLVSLLTSMFSMLIAVLGAFVCKLKINC